MLNNKKEANLGLPHCNFFPKNRRGSHVGIILSFVVFITFLIFLYTALEPVIDVKKGKENLVKKLNIELTERFSERLITAIIANNSDPYIYDCVKINNTELEAFGLNAISKNSSEDIIKSNLSEDGNFLYVDWSGNETYFKIYYSEEKFEEHPIERACANETDVYYQGLITWKEQVFISRVNETIERYIINYDSSKSELGVPSDSDFSFSFKLSDGTELKTKEINISKDVYVGEFPIQYVDEKAETKFGSLIIKVW